MKVLIAGGTGLVGNALIQHWPQHTITVLGRNKQHINDLYADNVTAVSWDELTPELMHSMDIVINLCGANIGSQRWSESRKQALRDSRIIPTQKLVEACIACGDQAPHIYNASGVGAYGAQENRKDCLPPPLDEQSPISTEPTDFITTLSRDWEAALQPAIDAGIAVTITRFAVILSADGGAFPKLAMPVKLGVGGPVGSGDQPFPWVSINDVCLIFDFLFGHQDITGPVNVVAPKCVRQIEFARSLAAILHRPCIIPTPALVMKLAFGQMAEEIILRGQHVIPSRLINAGYQFKYPDIDSALRVIT